jgi:hypothetical protein
MTTKRRKLLRKSLEVFMAIDYNTADSVIQTLSQVPGKEA